MLHDQQEGNCIFFPIARFFSEGYNIFGNVSNFEKNAKETFYAAKYYLVKEKQDGKETTVFRPRCPAARSELCIGIRLAAQSRLLTARHSDGESRRAGLAQGQ